MSEIPPPVPPPRSLSDQATHKTSASPATGADAQYKFMSEKIGFVPNLRKRDNLYQGICVLAFLIMGLTIGWFWNGWPIGVLAGAFIGLVVGALVSGFAIMVLGFFRKS